MSDPSAGARQPPADPDQACDEARDLLQRDQRQAAVDLLVDLVQRHPDHARALHMLGVLAAQSNRLDQALPALRQACALCPDDAQMHTSLSQVLLMTQQPLAAMQAVDHALALQPDHVAALVQRGHVLAMLCQMGMRRRSDAEQSYRRALALGAPADSIAFDLATLGVAQAPRHAPPEFVVALFDGYADHFDEHLVTKLAYRTPTLLAEALGRQVPGLHNAEVLDLGCGTGLCGPLLRPLARHLAGVDLSPRMLARAQATGQYDSLACGDAVAHLMPMSASLDLVVAADVLIYLGDLEPLFAALRQALRPGGHFCCSLEQPDSATPAQAQAAAQADFVLQANRHYAHSEVALRRLAARHGFTVRAAETVKLRENLGCDVMGTVAVLQRDALPV